MFPTYFLFNVALSLVIAYTASHKGRNPVGWFCLSFFSGLFWSANIIVLIVILLLPNLIEEKARLAHQGAWRRRHHESFEQERQVNRKFREQVIKRLDRQDEALGLPALEAYPIEAPESPKEIVTYPVMGNGTWYLVIDGQERGPIPESEVEKMLNRGEINGTTYAWSEGMQDWQRTGTIGNFSPHC